MMIIESYNLYANHNIDIKQMNISYQHLSKIRIHKRDFN